MVYAKKMIVMSGSGGKGTATIERSAAGVECRLTTFQLPDLKTGYYVLAVLSDRTQTFKLGSVGRLNARMRLETETRLENLHAAVVEVTDTLTVRLYGHNAATAMWESNLIDAVRRKCAPEPQTSQAQPVVPQPQTPEQPLLPKYSERNIADYFFDIFPTSGNYRDNAVSNVNYYAPDYREDTPTDRPSTDVQSVVESEKKHPDSVRVAEPDETSDRRGDAPSDLERAYLQRISATGRTTPQTERPAETIPERPRVTLKRAAAARDIPAAPRVQTAGAAHLRQAHFYERTATQLAQLFERHPRHERLEKLLPGTRWVRIDFDAKRYYAVGLVGDRPDYVCYAVPAGYTADPPVELKGYAVWVPAEPENPTGEGYWVMYQDAATGESVKRNCK